MGNKVHNSCVLIKNFPQKGNLHTMVSVQNHKNSILFENTLSTKAPTDTILVSTTITEWAQCCLHSGSSSTTTRHTQGFHNPNTKRVINITQIFSIYSKVLLAHKPTQLQQKFKETLPCSRTLQFDRPLAKSPPNTDGIDHLYTQLWPPCPSASRRVVGQ